MVPFWYLIAESNGLSGAETLAAGQVVTLPNKVHNLHNTADTWRPYDPNEAQGDLSPTDAKKPRGSKCGVFGQILQTIVAVAVTILLTPEIGPVGAAMAGNTASQLFGMAAGIQKGFNFKSLAITGITAGLTLGMGELSSLDGVTKGALALSKGVSTVGSLAKTAGFLLTGTVGKFVTAAAINAATQGIALVTHLQKRFDFAGVAAAGIDRAVSGRINIPGFEGRMVNSMAGGLANAAARSVINGTDFGDNLIAALPDVIAQTVGDEVGSGIRGAFGGKRSMDLLAAKQDAKLDLGLTKAVSPNYAKSFGFAGKVDGLVTNEKSFSDKTPSTLTGEEYEIGRNFGNNVETDQSDNYDGIGFGHFLPTVYPTEGVDPKFTRIGAGPEQVEVTRGSSNWEAMLDARTLQVDNRPRVNPIAGAIYILDPFLDLTGPSGTMQYEWTLRLIDSYKSQVKDINPRHSREPGDIYDRDLGAKALADMYWWRSELAAQRYIYQGDIIGLQVETIRTYQRFYDINFTSVLKDLSSGEVKMPEGDSWARFVGIETDARTRGDMAFWFGEHRLNENGRDINIAINQRLPASGDTYTRPDVRVGGVVIDGTLARKTSETPQVMGFYSNPNITNVYIARPTIWGGGYMLRRAP